MILIRLLEFVFCRIYLNGFVILNKMLVENTCLEEGP